ncbi:MAG: hypothetical protein H0W02_19695 [Ktedonobacteraceae bacterium]|nr:hypothetical protein [Ktedonobacteraceae bacterium]
MITSHPSQSGQAAGIVASLLKRRHLPRTFTLIWDHSKTKTGDLRGRQQQNEAFGCAFPNGLVALDNGQGFSVLSELHAIYDLRGSYAITWHDEEDEACASSQEH